MTNGAGPSAGNHLRRWSRDRPGILRAVAAIQRNAIVAGARAGFLPLADPGEDRAKRVLGTAESAVVQTDQARFRVEHQNEQIIVIVLLNADRRGDAQRFNEVRDGVAMADNQSVAG